MSHPAQVGERQVGSNQGRASESSVAKISLYEYKTSGRVSAQRQSQQVLSRVLEQRDQLLGIHIDDVAALARLTALELDLDDSEVERVVLTAELHDIGKSAIPDAILFKPGRLDADEFAFMKRHTIIGERIISGAPSLGVIAGIVRSTHERFDGRGYPDGLAGEAIPLAARIVFVCDAFDAMTSQRVYCPAVTWRSRSCAPARARSSTRGWSRRSCVRARCSRLRSLLPQATAARSNARTAS
ncbi:hypothetical protein BH20ACT16_BH20ACT16_12590 [soil metagenome]